MMKFSTSLMLNSLISRIPKHKRNRRTLTPQTQEFLLYNRRRLKMLRHRPLFSNGGGIGVDFRRASRKRWILHYLQSLLKSNLKAVKRITEVQARKWRSQKRRTWRGLLMMMNDLYPSVWTWRTRRNEPKFNLYQVQRRQFSLSISWHLAGILEFHSRKIESWLKTVLTIAKTDSLCRHRLMPRVETTIVTAVTGDTESMKAVPSQLIIIDIKRVIAPTPVRVLVEMIAKL